MTNTCFGKIVLEEVQEGRNIQQVYMTYTTFLQIRFITDEPFLMVGINESLEGLIHFMGLRNIYI